MAQLNFNANEVEPRMGFEVIPAGKYNAVIYESEILPARSGVGQYLKLGFVIIDGEYQNRKLWTRLTLDHPNPNAVRMAKANLSAICRAVGVMQMTDTTELHNRPLVITIRCRKTPDGELVNDINSYAPKTPAVTIPGSENPSHVIPWGGRA